MPAADHLPFATTDFALDKNITQQAIGIGDEVFTIGLFVYHKNTKRNEPVMRIGNIAAMPKEPIRTRGEYFDEMEAYLIETRSLGGLSGSPVFVNLQGIRNIGDGAFRAGTGGYELLGLIHGHWGLEAPDTDPTTRNVKLHTGISIVVPAKKILEVVHHPELQANVAREIARMKQTASATMDSTSGETEEAPFTKADFEEALRKASKSKSDEETT